MQNEKQTRKELISRWLAEAGWSVADHTQVVEEVFVTIQPNIEQLRILCNQWAYDYNHLRPYSAHRGMKPAVVSAFEKG